MGNKARVIGVIVLCIYGRQVSMPMCPHSSSNAASLGQRQMTYSRAQDWRPLPFRGCGSECPSGRVYRFIAWTVQACPGKARRPLPRACLNGYCPSQPMNHQGDIGSVVCRKHASFSNQQRYRLGRPTVRSPIPHLSTTWKPVRPSSRLTTSKRLCRQDRKPLTQATRSSV